MPGRPPQHKSFASDKTVTIPTPLPTNNIILPALSDSVSDVQQASLVDTIDDTDFLMEVVPTDTLDKAKPLLNVSSLQSSCFILPKYEVFC